MQRRVAMLESRRCGAKTRKGSRCQSPAMPNGRCRMHGGKSTGAPKGNKNAWKHGHYSKVAKAERSLIGQLQECKHEGSRLSRLPPSGTDKEDGLSGRIFAT